MTLDADTLTQIRERERALFRISQTILVITLILTVLFAVSLRVNADFMALWPLRDAAVGFTIAAESTRDSLSRFAQEALSWKPTPEKSRVSAIVAVENPHLPGMRVFIGDTLIGSTPALDTTHIKYVVTTGEMREEYYLPFAQQVLVDRLRKAWFPWFICGVEILMMAILYGFHRWIKKLSAEGKGES